MKRIFQALALAFREPFHHWEALMAMLTLYLAMIGAIYLFFVTREATIAQLLLSFLLALLAPVFFLIIQTMAARYRGESVWRLLASSARDFWKLLVIVLPLILIAVLAAYLFAKAGPASPATAVREAVRAAPAASRRVAPKPQPASWQTVAITTLEYLLFCLVLPLAAIQLWTRTACDGLSQTFRSSPGILARAFAPQSVVVYAIGFVFFAAIPYFLIVTTTHVANPWLEAGLLIVRLLLAAMFSLIGWVATVTALGELSKGSDPAGAKQSGEATSNVPAEA